MDEFRLLPEPEHGKLTALYRSAGLEIGGDWIGENHPVYSVAARRGEALLGAATVSRRFQRLVLDYLAVEPASRGMGLGKALAEACIRCAGDAGYEQLELQVAAENARALSLYRRLGFVEFGRNPRGFKSRMSGYQELVYMRLEL